MAKGSWADDGREELEVVEDACKFGKTVRRDRWSGHTVRREVGCPDSDQRRMFVASAYVRDREHVPQTKTWGCKLYEHQSGRKWLRRERQREHKVERVERVRKVASSRDEDTP